MLALLATSPPLEELPNFSGQLLRMIGVLVLMLVLGFAAILVLRRLSGAKRPTTRGGRMRVADRLTLEPGRTLHVIEIGGRYLLVGAGSHGLEILGGGPIDHDALSAAFDDAPATPPAPAAAVNSFKEHLR